MRQVTKLDHEEMTTAKQIADQIDIAMSILNSAGLAAHELGLCNLNNLIDDKLSHGVHYAWSNAYDARKILKKL